MIKAALVDAPPRLEAALQRLKSLHPRVIDLSLDRVRGLLERLGNPERRLPPVVHVAGTNGKGSTIAFLRAMLEAAGHRVHVYTSPHLVRFNERIRLAGSPIGDEALCDLLERCEVANGDAPVTYFEVTTCAAFLAFAETPADIVLLETGLGGRLDATNVLDRPVLTAITRISFDHMQFLGSTLAEIAWEKAGIMKADVPCVVQSQPEEAPLAVFRDRAAELGVLLKIGGRDWRVSGTESSFRFEGQTRTLDLPPPGLLGAHQLLNAGTAIACLDHLPLKIPDGAVAAGVVNVDWPARLQRLTHGPLASLLPQGWELWLDGGHNDSGGEVLAAQAARWTADGTPLALVYGMLRSKQPADFLAPLRSFASDLVAIGVEGEENALTPEEAAEAAHALGFNATAASDAGSAVSALARGPSGRVLICGSLYLAGTVLRNNG